MGIATAAEPPRERAEAKTGAVKQCVDLVKSSEEVNVLEVLEAGKKHSSSWIQELHVWPRTSALEFLSDNQTVAQWCAGSAPVEEQWTPPGEERPRHLAAALDRRRAR